MARRRRTVRARRPARRRAPARRRSTRKGMVRRTARRAYVPTRRRARRNPRKGIIGSPAFRYAAWSAGGAATEVVLNQTNLLKQMIPNRLARSAVFALAAIMIGRMAVKGARAKENMTALGVGIMIPSIMGQVSSLSLGGQLGGWFDGNGNGNGNGATSTTSALRRISNTQNPYNVAMNQAAAISQRGLKTA
jgi:hypothetical protein